MLRREVAWQSLWYLFALYITWGLYASVNLTYDSYARDYFYFWNFYFFLLPLQGFVNAWVYFRPRLSRRFSAFLDDLKKRRAQAKERQENNTVDDTPEQESSLTERIKKILWSRFRCFGSWKAHDFHDVEPAVDLLSANQIERESRVTLDSVVDQGNTHDVDPQRAGDEEEVLPVSVGDGLDMAPEGEATSIALHPDESDAEGLVVANEVAPKEKDQLGEAKEEEKEPSDSRKNLEVRKDEAIASRRSVLEKRETPEKDAIAASRRRSSLKMLANTLVGIDGAAWSSSGSASSDNS